jgi:hypothetical protein
MICFPFRYIISGAVIWDVLILFKPAVKFTPFPNDNVLKESILDRDAAITASYFHIAHSQKTIGSERPKTKVPFQTTF